MEILSLYVFGQMGLEILFMIIEVENKPFLFVCLFFWQNRSDNHLGKNQALSQSNVLAI